MIAGTTLGKERELMREFLGFTDEEFKKMDEYAIEGAFITAYQKRELKKRLDEAYMEKFGI